MELAGIMEQEFAERFANEWIAAWNSHDLDMSSPVIPMLVGEPSGILRGKTTVGAYWAKALRRSPDLHFQLVTVLAGVDSVTIYYKGHRGLSTEVLHFGPGAKVQAAFAHYAESPQQRAL